MEGKDIKISLCEEEASCGHCGCNECIWYDDFLDDEDVEE